MIFNDIYCDICSELYHESGPFEPRLLTCGHTICLTCLTNLLCSNLKRCCPYCKVSLDSHLNGHLNGHLSGQNGNSVISKYPKNYALINAINIKNELSLHSNDISNSNPPIHNNNNNNSTIDFSSSTNFEKINNLQQQQKQQQSQQKRNSRNSYFDLEKVQRLKEQANSECLHEKISLDQHSKDYFRHQRLRRLAEEHLKEIQYLEEQSLQRYQYSKTRLSKYESKLTLLESIITNSYSSTPIG